METQREPGMTVEKIRDIVITGSYMIGADGLKEPAFGWENYANRLEEILIKNNGSILPSPSKEPEVVLVVLPERADHTWGAVERRESWNMCLDEIIKLNPNIQFK